MYLRQPFSLTTDAAESIEGMKEVHSTELETERERETDKECQEKKKKKKKKKKKGENLMNSS